jgi:hypothetical protein
VAPFWKFLSGRFELRYASIDNEISPSAIMLQSSALNLILGNEINRLDFNLSINQQGIKQLDVNGKRFNITAKCTN